MKTYYGLNAQLIWVKIEGSGQTAEDFIIILDEDNFKKFANQTLAFLNTFDKK